MTALGPPDRHRQRRRRQSAGGHSAGAEGESPACTIIGAEATFEEPTWKIALAVEPIQNVRLYASYDRGYKAKAFPSAAQSKGPGDPCR